MTALTDSFPLRRTSVWGGVGANDVVPIRYGSVRGRCVPYTTANLDIPPGLQWVWSDGACIGVDDVWVDGVQSVAWRASNTADVTGAPIMLIEFSDPVDPSAVVSALGRGRIVDGAMARNPAVVLNDLLALAGFAKRDLAVFAAECDALGLTVDGEVSTDQTVQSVLRSVTASVGARFTSRARGTAVVHPGGIPVLVSTGPFIAAKLAPTLVTSASAAMDDVINSITINFALRDGTPARVMVIDAPESIARFGRRSATLDMPWLSIDSVAERVGSRLLKHSALPVYTVSAEGVRGDIRPGDWVSVDPQVRVPFISGAYRVTASEHAPSTGLSDIQFQAFASDDVSVEVVSIAEIGADKQTLATGGGITVQANPPTPPTATPQQGGQPVQITAQPGRILRTQYFLSDGVFTPSQGLIDAGGTVEVFLVAGGASGAGAATDPAPTVGGGGGGGQVRRVIVEGVVSPTAVTIGAGGVGGAGGSVPGGDTEFGDAVALGGASGVGGSGGVSGGGGGGAGGVGGDAAATNTIAGTAGVFGGAGGFGTNEIASSGGVGGIGIDGYGGGGGGGSVIGAANVGRGSSGGGDGGWESAGLDANPNSGGGGGGGATIGDPPAASNGGNGGSGICIVTWWE